MKKQLEALASSASALIQEATVAKKKIGPVDVRTARKLEAFGKLAAFLDGFDGHPLDGVIEWFRQGWPMGLFTEAEAECIRLGYHNKKGTVL